MEKKSWYTLNLDISNALRKDLDLDKMRTEFEFRESPVMTWFYREDRILQLLSQEWLDYMKDLHIDIVAAIVFYRNAYYVHQGAHIDLGNPDIPGPTSGINWVIDPADDSEMVWYNTPTAPPELRDGATRDKQVTTYDSWDWHNLGPQIDSRTIGTTPTLVRTDIPHNIIVRAVPRWVISVRTSQLLTESWEDTVAAFKPFIIC